MNTNRYRLLAPVLARTLLLLAVPLVGCEGKTPALTGSGMDMFTPVKMRLHPLSRIIPPAAPPAEPTVEARIEFTDQFEDIGKGAGAVYFELYIHEALKPKNRGERIGLWNFDLNKAPANKQHWDGITRTYLCKLPLQMGSAAVLKQHSRVILVAVFTLPNGTRITDDMVINLR